MIPGLPSSSVIVALIFVVFSRHAKILANQACPFHRASLAHVVAPLAQRMMALISQTRGDCLSLGKSLAVLCGCIFTAFARVSNKPSACNDLSDPIRSAPTLLFNCDNKSLMSPSLLVKVGLSVYPMWQHCYHTFAACIQLKNDSCWICDTQCYGQQFPQWA